ncbi:MAG TPA: helix-turn-helix transcriptional regulator [Candidatus Limnocylindria bacterium]
MDDASLSRCIRMLRHRRGWRQADLAVRAGVSAGAIGLIERAWLERVSLRIVRRVASALDLRLGWDVGVRGADLARLADADHASCADLLMRRLTTLGWLTRAEVSFNEYGDRGRIDVLAFHPATATLLVVEIKTLIVDAQELLGGLDVKQRIGLRVGRSVGWAAKVVVPALVVMDTTTNRRRIGEHPHLFGRFALRGRRASSWLRSPAPHNGGMLIMLKLPNRKHRDLRRAGRQRVRPTAPRAIVSQRPEPSRRAAELA